MPVKRNSYDIKEVISKKVTAGVVSYLVKVRNYSGSFLKWINSYDVPWDNEKILDFERTLNEHNAKARKNRLKNRETKKKRCVF